MHFIARSYMYSHFILSYSSYSPWIPPLNCVVWEENLWVYSILQAITNPSYACIIASLVQAMCRLGHPTLKGRGYTYFVSMKAISAPMYLLCTGARCGMVTKLSGVQVLWIIISDDVTEKTVDSNTIVWSMCRLL